MWAIAKMYHSKDAIETPEQDDGCFKGRSIVLLGLFSGRGMDLVAPPPLFDRYNAVLDEMLKTYQPGNMDSP